MIIVFIVHSLADSLMNFPSHCFRGTAQKLILMKVENCMAVQANNLFFFFSILQTGSGIVWLPSASVNALNTWAQFNDKKNEAEALPSGFTFHGFTYLVVRFNFSSTGELKTVNNLRVAPCVPASTGHTTPCHSAVSGSVATTHSLTPLAAAAKNSKMCVFQIYTLDLLIE